MDKKHTSPRTSGQSLVEFAIILTVVLLLILGSIDAERHLRFQRHPERRPRGRATAACIPPMPAASWRQPGTWPTAWTSAV